MKYIKQLIQFVQGLVNLMYLNYLLLKYKVLTKSPKDSILYTVSCISKVYLKRFSSKRIKSRSAEDSINLMYSLADLYADTRSEIYLKQLVEVLQEEIIKR